MQASRFVGQGLVQLGAETEVVSVSQLREQLRAGGGDLSEGATTALKVALRDQARKQIHSELMVSVTFVPTVHPGRFDAGFGAGESVAEAASILMLETGRYRVYVLEAVNISNEQAHPNRQSLLVTCRRRWRQHDKQRRTSVARRAGTAAVWDQCVEYSHTPNDIECMGAAVAKAKSKGAKETEAGLALELVVKNQGVQFGREVGVGKCTVLLHKALANGEQWLLLRPAGNGAAAEAGAISGGGADGGKMWLRVSVEFVGAKQLEQEASAGRGASAAAAGGMTASMTGAVCRPLPPPTVDEGRLHLIVARAHGLAMVQKGGLNDPFVKVEFKPKVRGAKKYRTPPLDEVPPNQEPIWNHYLKMLYLPSAGSGGGMGAGMVARSVEQAGGARAAPYLYVHVWDTPGGSGGGQDLFIGGAEVPLSCLHPLGSGDGDTAAQDSFINAKAKCGKKSKNELMPVVKVLELVAAMPDGTTERRGFVELVALYVPSNLSKEAKRRAREAVERMKAEALSAGVGQPITAEGMAASAAEKPLPGVVDLHISSATNLTLSGTESVSEGVVAEGLGGALVGGSKMGGVRVSTEVGMVLGGDVILGDELRATRDENTGLSTVAWDRKHSFAVKDASCDSVLVQVNTTTYDGEGDIHDVLGVVKVPLDDLRLSSNCKHLADPGLMMETPFAYPILNYDDKRQPPIKKGDLVCSLRFTPDTPLLLNTGLAEEKLLASAAKTKRKVLILVDGVKCNDESGLQGLNPIKQPDGTATFDEHARREAVRRKYKVIAKLELPKQPGTADPIFPTKQVKTTGNGTAEPLDEAAWGGQLRWTGYPRDNNSRLIELDVGQGLDVASTLAGSALAVRLSLYVPSESKEVGSVLVPLEACLGAPGTLFDREVTFCQPEPANAGGTNKEVATMDLKMQLVPTKAELEAAAMKADPSGETEVEDFNPFDDDADALSEQQGTLMVRVLECKNLLTVSAEQDPYVQLQVSPEQLNSNDGPRTHTVLDGGRHPKFNCSFPLGVDDASVSYLSCIVRDACGDKSIHAEAGAKSKKKNKKKAKVADREIGRYEVSVYRIIKMLRRQLSANLIPGEGGGDGGASGADDAGGGAVQAGGSGNAEFRDLLSWCPLFRTIDGKHMRVGEVRLQLAWQSSAHVSNAATLTAQPWHPLRYCPGPGRLVISVKEARNLRMAGAGAGAAAGIRGSGAGGVDVKARLTMRLPAATAARFGGGGSLMVPKTDDDAVAMYLMRPHVKAAASRSWVRELTADEHYASGEGDTSGVRWTDDAGLTVAEGVVWERDVQHCPLMQLELLDEMVPGGHTIGQLRVNLAPYLLHPTQPGERWYPMNKGKDGQPTGEVKLGFVYYPAGVAMDRALDNPFKILKELTSVAVGAKPHGGIGALSEEGLKGEVSVEVKMIHQPRPMMHSPLVHCAITPGCAPANWRTIPLTKRTSGVTSKRHSKLQACLLDVNIAPPVLADQPTPILHLDLKAAAEGADDSEEGDVANAVALLPSFGTVEVPLLPFMLLGGHVCRALYPLTFRGKEPAGMVELEVQFIREPQASSSAKATDYADAVEIAIKVHRATRIAGCRMPLDKPFVRGVLYPHSPPPPTDTSAGGWPVSLESRVPYHKKQPVGWGEDCILKLPLIEGCDNDALQLEIWQRDPNPHTDADDFGGDGDVGGGLTVVKKGGKERQFPEDRSAYLVAWTREEFTDGMESFINAGCTSNLRSQLYYYPGMGRIYEVPEDQKQWRKVPGGVMQYEIMRGDQKASPHVNGEGDEDVVEAADAKPAAEADGLPSWANSGVGVGVVHLSVEKVLQEGKGKGAERIKLQFVAEPLDDNDPVVELARGVEVAVSEDSGKKGGGEVVVMRVPAGTSRKTNRFPHPRLAIAYTAFGKKGVELCSGLISSAGMQSAVAVPEVAVTTEPSHVLRRYVELVGHSGLHKPLVNLTYFAPLQGFFEVQTTAVKLKQMPCQGLQRVWTKMTQLVIGGSQEYKGESIDADEKQARREVKWDDNSPPTKVLYNNFGNEAKPPAMMISVFGEFDSGDGESGTKEEVLGLYTLNHQLIEALKNRNDDDEDKRTVILENMKLLDVKGQPGKGPFNGSIGINLSFKETAVKRMGEAKRLKMSLDRAHAVKDLKTVFYFIASANDNRNDGRGDAAGSEVAEMPGGGPLQSIAISDLKAALKGAGRGCSGVDKKACRDLLRFYSPSRAIEKVYAVIEEESEGDGQIRWEEYCKVLAMAEQKMMARAMATDGTDGLLLPEGVTAEAKVDDDEDDDGDLESEEENDGWDESEGDSEEEEEEEEYFDVEGGGEEEAEGNPLLAFAESNAGLKPARHQSGDYGGDADANGEGPPQGGAVGLARFVRSGMSYGPRGVPMFKWGTENVAKWLKERVFATDAEKKAGVADVYVEKFREAGVDGLLLMELTDTHFEKDLGITNGIHRTKIRTHRDKLRDRLGLGGRAGGGGGGGEDEKQWKLGCGPHVAGSGGWWGAPTGRTSSQSTVITRKGGKALAVDLSIASPSKAGKTKAKSNKNSGSSFSRSRPGSSHGGPSGGESAGDSQLQNYKLAHAARYSHSLSNEVQRSWKQGFSPNRQDMHRLDAKWQQGERQKKRREKDFHSHAHRKVVEQERTKGGGRGLRESQDQPAESEFGEEFAPYTARAEDGRGYMDGLSERVGKLRQRTEEGTVARAEAISRARGEEECRRVITLHGDLLGWLERPLLNVAQQYDLTTAQLVETVKKRVIEFGYLAWLDKQEHLIQQRREMADLEGSGSDDELDQDNTRPGQVRVCSEHQKLEAAYEEFRHLQNRSAAMGKNYKLTRLKMRAAIKTLLRIKMTYEQFDVFFRAINVDPETGGDSRDTELDVEEFCEAFNSHSDAEAMQSAAQRRRMRNAMTNMWMHMAALPGKAMDLSTLCKCLDRSGDGAVSPAEFGTFVRLLLQKNVAVRSGAASTGGEKDELGHVIVTKDDLYHMMTLLDDPDDADDPDIPLAEVKVFFFKCWWLQYQQLEAVLKASQELDDGDGDYLIWSPLDGGYRLLEGGHEHGSGDVIAAATVGVSGESGAPLRIPTKLLRRKRQQLKAVLVRDFGRQYRDDHKRQTDFGRFQFLYDEIVSITESDHFVPYSVNGTSGSAGVVAAGSGQTEHTSSAVGPMGDDGEQQNRYENDLQFSIAQQQKRKATYAEGLAGRVKHIPTSTLELDAVGMA
jgi:hypothetical protein